MEQRVCNPLPIPEQCDACASLNIVHTGNEVIYGKPRGDWPFIWFCEDCKAIVGCHPGTNIPFGKMADRKTRQLRSEAHRRFDPLWKKGTAVMTRDEAYERLAKHLGIERKACHLSQITTDQLKAVIAYCIQLHEGNQLQILKRRSEKNNAKRIERNDREKRKGKRFNKYEKRNSSVKRSRRCFNDCGEDS